mmetsp:Transcript_15584/g.40299  ORF Transcript_15584/g.40299 Transcript_15584/m.40299 type:complete len:110 (+) Transcript_15584:131-460(+)
MLTSDIFPLKITLQGIHAASVCTLCLPITAHLLPRNGLEARARVTTSETASAAALLSRSNDIERGTAYEEVASRVEERERALAWAAAFASACRLRAAKSSCVVDSRVSI